MSTKCDILDSMPQSADETAAWFDTMSFSDFDHVCVSAVTLTLDDERTDNGFISSRSIAVLLNAMRNRYRKVITDTRTANPTKEAGESHHAATINEWQARIIRRIPKGAKGCGHVAIAKVFGTSQIAVYKIRAGRTWKHLDRREAA